MELQRPGISTGGLSIVFPIPLGSKKLSRFFGAER